MALTELSIPETDRQALAAQARGQKMALQLFHYMAERVPAYGAFLKKMRVKPADIQTADDWLRVPLVDKKNYLTQYPLADLCWDGSLFNDQIISVSSGSTGEPFFWPRGDDQEAEGAWMHEQLFNKVFELNRKSTLVVVCFSMGTWIAGSFTQASCQRLSKQYRLNIVTPGIEQTEAIKVVKRLGKLYDQIILCGYPPFLKDIVDQGKADGIDWRKHKLRFLFAGENYSEEWRDYVLRLSGQNDPFHQTTNLYGTADAAMLGHETPVSIAARRVYSKRLDLLPGQFGSEILPTIVQYYPHKRYFEPIDGELVFSADAGLPLVRYNIHDAGGVMNLTDLVKPVAAEYDQLIRKAKINPADWQLPFVYLHGRKDFTVTIYAVNIYPENIKAALIDPKMRSWATGKFTMATKYKNDMDQYWEVNLELAGGVKPDDQYSEIAHSTILKKLQDLNAEFRKLFQSVGDRAEPKINLIEHGNPDYFSRGAKHRWVGA